MILSISVLSQFFASSANTFNGMEDINIIISDVLGKKVISKRIPNFSGKYSQEINLKKFKKGLYFVEIQTENKKLTKKIIVQ